MRKKYLWLHLLPERILIFGLEDMGVIVARLLSDTAPDLT